ncbi:hypothetical protein B0T14DRAFT_432037 [Immersiella caudata]|uniref:Uncharacterized protein n=1 Tax=Immersiella caudata TaxID=314043 RepID=A0AA40C155_9PEZI|nr:hypothetical protein B0T14DRAFT_432037 [Immersiella caudata]
MCSFHLPTVQRCLWPAALQQGRVGEELVGYAKRWAELPRCKREDGAVYADSMSWFVLVDDEIPGFLACEGCFEGVIRATRFAARFERHGRGQAAGEKWRCDASLGFVARALLHRSRLDDWAGFVGGVGRRMKMEACSSKMLTANSATWFRPRGAPASFRVCETCYADAYAESRFEAAFERVEETALSKWEVVQCSAKGNIPFAQLAFVATVAKKPVEYLRAGQVEIACKPKCCTKEGIVDGRFYNFKEPVGNFGVCEACFVGCIRSVGMDVLFAERPRTVVGAAYCVFNPHGARFGQFVDLYNEGLETGVFDGYESAVRKWSPILRCAGREALSGRAWYGWEDCRICLECYETFVAGTKLASEMPLQNSYHEGPNVCSMYSPRQRERYTQACEKASAEELLATTRIRMAVYLETVMVIKQMRQQQEAEMNAADTEMFISATHLSSDIMGTVFGSNTYTYTNSGYKSNEGIMADKAWNSGIAMRQRALDPGRMMEIERLEARWAEYE